ncbi:hypothetical protein EV692_0045 [Lonepinella koalarum]|uniref:Uncharacterized protein n=1 Tax=Lonepinella koalarum TaxID=53417 RepID=A0A4R1KZP9_9PAST|nr:hypothetical protein EV692_0045 [Lonepinella koalarum]
MWLSIGLTILAFMGIGVCIFAYSLLNNAEQHNNTHQPK